jgi:sugar phosphate isomerase/epimerase
VALYRRVIDHFQDRVRRLVLHPDSVDRKVAREAQIQLLAASVAEIKDRLPELQVCIEPRGGDRQNKVLRLELQDILNLKKHLCAIGAFEQIGLCIDLAQAVIVHGNARTIKFLDELNSTDFQILELHLSDVGLDQNRVAVEVGKGRIDWPKLFPSALNCCKAVLIETLGGIKVFQRSQAYLHTLVNNAEILL